MKKYFSESLTIVAAPFFIIYVLYYFSMFFRFWKRKKVGLVLGGGVARGIAHIGILKVLHSYKVPIDFIVGTSSGSLVGVGYAAGMDVSLIEEIALHIRWQDLLKFTFFRPGFVSGEAIENFVIKYLGDKNFSDLKIPFAAVATDLRSGEAVIISEGKVAKAVAASSAFPGVFAPEEVEGRFLVDGGVASNVAVAAARKMGADYVIACDVIPEKIVQIPRDPLQTLGRCLDLILKKLSKAEASLAEVLITLETSEDIWHLDLHKAKKLIAAGEVAAHRVINKIKRDLRINT
ncbi:MAG: patatin-like phospholipase family protein [Candidatus Margulisiibacteriota bacterium]